MSAGVPRCITVISPHLDDAVFSCGNLIAAAPHARIVTVLAGQPPASMPAPEWDRAAGFAHAIEAVAARRHEDIFAGALLGAETVWLDFLDSQYAETGDAWEIAERLADVLASRRETTVVAPLGLFHVDHQLVHTACMLLYGRLGRGAGAAHGAPCVHADRFGVCASHRASNAEGDEVAGDSDSDRWAGRWLFYEDAIYRRIPGVVQARLSQWWHAGLVATEVELPPTEMTGRKQQAVASYASQLPLFDAGCLTDLRAPERYWSLERSTGPQGARICQTCQAQHATGQGTRPVPL